MEEEKELKITVAGAGYVGLSLAVLLSQKYEVTVLEILEEICEDEVVYEDKDINLKEEGLMDSLAFVELLVRMEEFGIEVAPTEVTYEDIDTPNKIIQYIETRVKQ